MKGRNKDTNKASVKQDFTIILFLLKQAASVSKLYGLMFTVNVLCRAISPVLWVLMPKFILDELMGQQRMPVLLGILGLLLGLVLVLDGAGYILYGWLYKNNVEVFLHMQRELSAKVMEMDYPYLEDPKTLDLKEKAINGLRYGGGVQMMGWAVQKLLSSIISLLMLMSIIVTLHWALTLSLIGVVLLITLVNNQLRKIVYKFWDLLTEFNRKFEYLNTLMFSFKFGKDLRLAGMKEMLLEKNESYRKQCHEYYLGQGNRELKKQMLLNLIGFLQALLVYGFTTALAFLGKISISSFVMYISAASSMVASAATMTESIIDLKRVCQYSYSYYEFYSLKPKMKQGSTAVPKDENWELSLENVSFTYPGTDNPVLKNVSLTLKSGQKLSIVGVNGAGKTTLVKLLLRLFDPDEGRILLNGIDIRDFKTKEYWEKFSVVFQNYQIFAGTVAENIGESENPQSEKLLNAIAKANLEEVVRELPNKQNTQLLKSFHKDGMELSGGQNGRVALARAVYKGAPIVILDEPTAALDPIAEYELYHHFHELVRDKTTVYISHRLSSCRFCDLIAVFDGGELVEYGSHKELSALKDGKYAKMWETQAKYYV